MTASVVTVIERAKIDAINHEHALCERAYADTLTHAIECGRMLTGVKATLSHGDWLPWLEDYFDGSKRVAQTYMQLAGAPAEMQEAQTSAHLSIDAALKQLSKPKPRQPSSRDAVGMVGGLEDDDAPDPDGATVIVRERLDQAQRRLQSDTGSPWNDQHSRRRNRIVEMLDEARGQLDHASDPGLSPHAIAEMLRSAEIKARQAQAQLGDLAFGFER